MQHVQFSQCKIGLFEGSSWASRINTLWLARETCVSKVSVGDLNVKLLKVPSHIIIWGKLTAQHISDTGSERINF